MSILPSLKVTLDQALDEQACREAHEKISKLKGVLSTSFNGRDKDFVVTYRPGSNVYGAIRLTKGVSSVNYQL